MISLLRVFQVQNMAFICHYRSRRCSGNVDTVCEDEFILVQPQCSCTGLVPVGPKKNKCQLVVSPLVWKYCVEFFFLHL